MVQRAYTDDGDALGSMENDECRIDSIAQSGVLFQMQEIMIKNIYQWKA